MITLKNVLIFKIVVTIVFWIAPTLLISKDWMECLGFPRPGTMLWIRLLSVAFIALVVAYSLGLSEIIKGKQAIWVVWMGIVSNGGGSIVLLWFLIFEQFEKLPRIAISVSVTVSILITIGLIYTGLINKPKTRGN